MAGSGIYTELDVIEVWGQNQQSWCMMKGMAANRGFCGRSGGALVPHRHSANTASAPPVWFLVADVKDIKCVINFDMPNTAEVCPSSLPIAFAVLTSRPLCSALC